MQQYKIGNPVDYDPFEGVEETSQSGPRIGEPVDYDPFEPMEFREPRAIAQEAPVIQEPGAVAQTMGKGIGNAVGLGDMIPHVDVQFGEKSPAKLVPGANQRKEVWEDQATDILSMVGRGVANTAVAAWDNGDFGKTQDELNEAYRKVRDKTATDSQFIAEREDWPTGLAQGLLSVPYSAVTMGSSLLGRAAGAVGGPATSYAGAGLAAGATAYRASRHDFMGNVLLKATEELGRVPSPEEWAAAEEKFDRAAMEYSGWEAIPEAVGNAIFLGIVGPGSRWAANKMRGALGAGLVSRVAGGPVGRVTAGAVGTQAEEQLMEGITGWGQGGVEARVGMRDKAPTIREAYAESFAPTFWTTLVTGTAGTTGGHLIDKWRESGARVTEQRDAEAAAAEAERAELEARQAKEAARAALEAQEAVDLLALENERRGLVNALSGLQAQGQAQEDMGVTPDQQVIEQQVGLGRPPARPAGYYEQPIIGPEQAQEFEQGLAQQPGPVEAYPVEDLEAEWQARKAEQDAMNQQARLEAEWNARQQQISPAPAAVDPTTAPPSVDVSEQTGALPVAIDEKVHEAATSPLNNRPEPTQGQKEAGNYKKAKLSVNGLMISIENPAGSERSGQDAQGNKWFTQMRNHYGYIKGTKGADKEHIDTFLGPDPKGAQSVFVVDQVDPETGAFDEHKAMIGFESAEQAREAYLDNYEDGWQGVGAITEMPVTEFKKWAKSPKARLPLAEQKAPAVKAKPAPLTKKASKAKKEEYSTTPDTPGVTTQQVRSAFPKALIKETPEGWEIAHGGTKVRIAKTGEIKIDEAAFEKTYGRKATADERALGSFAVVDGEAVISLTNEAGEATLFHETWHAAERMALKPEEVKVVEKEHGDSESRANAYAAWLKDRQSKTPVQKMFQKVFDFFSRIKALFHKNASDVFREVATGRSFEKSAKAKDTKAQYHSKSEEMQEDRKWAKHEPARTKDGKIKGAPEWVQNDKDLARMRRDMRKFVREGLTGRMWYENSAESVLKMVKGDVALAEKFIQLLAIYSPNSNVWVNSIQAVRAYSHWARKAPKDSFSVGSADTDSKATSVLYDNKPWAGRKTNSFYLNLMYDLVQKHPKEVAKLDVDNDLITAITQPATIDVWMARGFGYKVEQFGNDKGTGQYSFAENEVRRLTALLNLERQPGTPRWTPHQVQASVWTAVKTRYEIKEVKDKTNALSQKQGIVHKKLNDKGKLEVIYPKKAEDKRKHLANWRRYAMQVTSAQVTAEAEARARSFGDDIHRMTNVVTWEANPSTAFGYAINNASPKVLQDFTAEARALLIDEQGNDILAQILGVPLSFSVNGFGAYAGAVSPNNLSHLLPSRAKGQEGFSAEEVRLYARAIQYIYKQDAVPWFRPENKTLESVDAKKKQMFKVINSVTGKLVLKGRFETQAEAEAFLKKKGPGFEIRGGDLARAVVLQYDKTLESEDLGRVLSGLREYLGDDAGFTRTASNEITLINFRDDGTKLPWVHDEAFLDAVDSFIADHGTDLGITESKRILTEGEYGPVHDWSQDKEGSEIIAGGVEGSLSGRPDLHPWLRDRRAAFDALIEQYSGEGRGDVQYQVAARRPGDPGVSGLRTSALSVDQRYGEAKEGADSVLGIHYSREPRETLSGNFYGTGIKGAEAKRLALSTDPRTKSRIHFYVDTGQGIRPEPGVGANIHAVHLDNLYDTDKDTKGLLAALIDKGVKGPELMNALESAILDAGFDGFYVPRAQSTKGVAVLLGDHTSVPVEQIKGAQYQVADVTSSAAFKKWFKGSKAVGEDGKPQIVYHGTDASMGKDFAFETGKKTKRYTTFSEQDVESQGMFFSLSQEDAESYGGNVGGFYLSATNPLVNPNEMPLSSASSQTEKDAVNKVFEDLHYILEPEMQEQDAKGNWYINSDSGISTTKVDKNGDWVDKIFKDDMLDWSYLDNPEVVRRLKERGYDSVRVYEPNDQSGMSWFVTNPAQIKSATGNSGAFDPADARVNYQNSAFYSAVERAIVAMDFKAIPAADLLNRVKKLPGIKAEEMDDLGLPDWLAGMGKDKVTKDQVLEFVKQGGPQIEEVKKGAEEKTEAHEKAYNMAINQLIDADAYDDRATRIMDAWFRDPNQDNTLDAEELFIDNDLEWDATFGGTIGEAESSGATKFGGYQMPGGENYREVLLTLPPTFRFLNDVERRVSTASEKMDALEREGVTEDDPRWETANREMVEAQNARDAAFDRAHKMGQGEEYKSSHWDEPNVLAHVRLNDRTGPNGEKVLFIEEIQSDWHQEGRKKGYKTDKIPDGFKDPAFGSNFNVTYGSRKKDLADAKAELPAARAKAEAAVRAMYEKVGVSDIEANAKAKAVLEDSTKWEGAATALLVEGDTLRKDIESYGLASGRVRLWESEISRIEKDYNRERAVDAPFKKSWSLLAFKRVLRMAAEQGYDSVAWTPGAVQAERYDLSKHIESVNAEKTKKGDWKLEIIPHGGGLMDTRFVTESALEATVGKELAEKIVERDGGMFSGLDLRVGGEGMKGFYDRILPAEISKYAKKWGVKVGKTTVNTPTESMGVTNADLWAAGYQDHPISTTTDMTKKPVTFKVEVHDPQRKVIATFPAKTREEATAIARRELDKILGRGFKEAHSLPITDAMREDVMKGQPLYQSEKAPGLVDLKAAFPWADSIETDGDGRTVVTKGKNSFAVTQVEQITPDEVSFKIQYKRAFDPKTDKIAGEYRDGEIRLTKVADNWTAQHEYYHALEDMGLVNKMEQGLLNTAAKKGGYNQAPSENRAYYVQDQLAARDFDRKTALGRLLQKLADYMDSFANLFTRTARGVVRDVESGKMMEREAGDVAAQDAQYAVRTKPAPKKTVKAYKLFRVDAKRPGELFPLFVSMDGDVSIPIGSWQDAEEGTPSSPSKTGKPQVKSRLGDLAYRPGFHAGDLPIAHHIGKDRARRLDPETGEMKSLPTTRRENEVWAEVEMAADKDWQTTANSRAVPYANSNPKTGAVKGRPNPKTAAITDGIPVDGYYKYKTNPNMTGNWLIGGAMKINRVLTDAEVDAINSAAGVKDLPRKKAFDAKKYGFEGPQYALARSSGPAPQYALSGVPARVRAELQPKVDYLRMKFQDKFLPLLRVQEMLIKEGWNMTDEANGYRAEERSSGKAGQRLENLLKKQVGPLLDKMKAQKVTLQQLDDYLYAKFAPQRNAHIASINPKMPDGGSGRTNQWAADKMAEFAQAGMTNKLEALAKDVRAIVQMQRDIIRNEGLEMPDTVDAWELANPDYVTLKGGKEETRRTIGTGFNIKRSGTKRALGRSTPATDLLVHTVAQIGDTIIRAEKAVVGRAFLKMVEQNPNEELWRLHEHLPTKRAMVKKTNMARLKQQQTSLKKLLALKSIKPNTRAAATRHLADVQAAIAAGGTKKVGSVVDMSFPQKDNVLTVTREDGSLRYIEIFDDDLARVMKNLTPGQHGRVVQGIATFTRFLSMVNTQLNPQFVLTNLLRDLQTAMIHLSGEQSLALATKIMKSVPSAMGGIYNQLRGDGSKEWAVWYDMFKDAGGHVSFMDLRGVDQIKKDIEAAIGDTSTGAYAISKAGAMKLFKLIGDVNTMVENAVRLSAFRHLVESGTSESDAASYAKNITVNFNRKGELGPAANAFYMFFNAGVQGPARILFSLKNRRVQKIVTAITIMAWGLAELAVLTGGDDEDGEAKWDKHASEWVKQTNLIIMLPSGDSLKIKLPYGYNFFVALGYSLSDVRRWGANEGGKNPAEAAVFLFKAAMNAFNPMGDDSLLQMISPTVMDPFVQIATNENFMGTKIVPEQAPWGPEKPNSQLFFRSSSKPSRAIAEQINALTGGDKWDPGAIDISPEWIDHITDFLSGGLGSTARDMLSLPAVLTDPDIAVRRIPFLKHVYQEKDSRIDMNRFYENAQKIEKAKARRDEVPPSDRKDFIEEYPEIILVKRAEGLKRRMSSLRKELYKHQDAGDKVKALEIEEKMRKLALGFNKRYNEVTRGVGR